MRENNGGGVIRVMVAATSAVRRGGLEAMVRENSSFKLVGSAAGLAGLAERVQELQAEVVLVDLPQADPQFASRAAALQRAGTAVVVLIDEPDANWTSRALRADVRALLAREASREEIHSAIQAASNGMVLLDPEIAKDLLAGNRQDGAADPTLETFEELTPREIEVLRMMAEGLGNKEIAARLGISDHTVKFHISSILAKTGASTRTEAVTLGIRMGLILI
ncbi:MAG: DNA-binding response regulator [Acidobacteria bacterium]|nr:MAG: DNA-binding response regulator [Acidobacteriota bacterium]